MASKQVAPETSSTVPVKAADKVRQAVEEMKRESSDVSDQIMANILAADTVDDVFDMAGGEAGTLIASEARYGTPLRVTAVTLNESRFSEGPPAYCVLECTNLGTGAVEMIGCGASNIVAGMIKLHQLDAFPIDVVIFESVKQTANGYNVVLMRKATDADIQQAKEQYAGRF